MIKVVETPDSRGFTFGAQDGAQTFTLNVVTTAGESESQIYLFALSNSEPYYNGLIRNNIAVKPQGAPNLWRVEIEYGTTGVGGGDQPLGGAGNDNGPPPQPTGPESPTAALKGGWSFSIRAPRLHVTQSNLTMVRVLRAGANLAAAPNFLGAIGVTEDGADVEGCDWPPEPAFKFKRDVARAVVTQAYLDTLAELAGKYNNADWYWWKAGEVIFLGADGQYTQGEGWSISFEFGVEKNQDNVVICDGLPPLFATIPKKGHEFLWVAYERAEDPVSGALVKRPLAAYVEQITEPVDFTRLGIGT